MVAASLTSHHVLSMFPSKLGFSKTQDLAFRCPGFRLNRQDTRRLRFSFFLLRCQRAGGLEPSIQCGRRDIGGRVPFRAVPAMLRQLH